MKIDIKEAVKSDVMFLHYRDGNLWYRTNRDEQFPVPISDVGNATFNARDRGILFMRYMRKWNAQQESI